MINPSTIEKAAAAIANARGGRRGMPAIANILELLPQSLKDEVREDAEDVLNAAGYAELLDALKAITAQAQSWHDFHHGSETIQCDGICAALPAAQAAIKKAEEEQGGRDAWTS